jgi:hypothetical protein
MMDDAMAQFGQGLKDPIAQRAFQDAQKMAGMMQAMRRQQQKATQQARVAPITNALSSLGAQWQAATTDEGRNTAHGLADKTRSAYITGGGSPTDLGQQYWGSDPSQGFEGEGGFSAPITGYEGLARKDTVDYTRDALAAERKRRIDEAGLTGVDPQTGQASLEGKYKNYLMSKPTGGGNSSTKAPPSLYDQAKDAAYNDPRLYTGKLAAGDSPPSGMYTTEDLIAAWMQQIDSKNKGGGATSGSGGGFSTPQSLLQYLK